LNRLLESVTASDSLEEGLGCAVKEVDALFRSRTAVLLATALSFLTMSALLLAL